MTALLFLDRKSSPRSSPIDLSLNGRLDPTKTNALRARYERDLVRRFRKVQVAVVNAILADKQLATNAAFDAATSPAKIDKFMRFLRKLQDKEVLEIERGTPTKSGAKRWQDVYLRTAYQKGLAQGYGSIRKAGVEVRQDYIDSAFYRPIHADRAGLIYTRAYTDLEGITTAVDTKLSATLAQGILEGKGVQQIAKTMRDNIDSIGVVRSKRLARTEVIRAHAEATLNSFEEATIEGVELVSEFSTSRDGNVCPKCSALEGKQYTVDEARGVLPVHPNCRCIWTPVVTDAVRRKIP